jgi:ABC-type glycerol-3-phosphate transport system permease component
MYELNHFVTVSAGLFLAIGNLILVLLGYAALTVWLSHTLRGIRLRNTALWTSLLVVPVVLLAAVVALLVLHVPLPIGLIFPTALGVLCGLTILLSKVLAPQEPVIPTRETKPTILHLILISGSALFLIPFVWLVGTSLKSDAQLTIYPPVWIPHPVLWKNYPDALAFLPKISLDGLVNVRNTLIIAIMSVIGTVLSSSLVAYGFARLRWPGKDWVFGLVLATMMLPDAVTMMPRFLIFRELHWIDTLFPLWVPSFFASAFNVFLLRQFFLGIPKELEDAAKIDGCGYFGTWWRIMIPMVKTPIAAVTIMSFLASWKDFLGPLIYISSPEKMPLSYVLQLYNSSHGGEPQYLMAVTTLVILPVVVLFFFTQRYFVEGVSLSGLGGR